MEPTMGEIIFCYIKVKGSKLCQDDPHTPMKLSYASKAHYIIGWDIVIQVRISHY